jgi:hypothetical protein
MLTVVSAAGELAYPLLVGWGCTFEVLSTFVLLPPPQAATANEVSATRRTA